MENASKALIIAAEVLIGVMIISVAVYLFNTFGQYSAETYQKIDETQIAEFNNRFLKYYGQVTIEDENGKIITEDIKCTIHDIVSLVNLAKKNNSYYELDSEKGYKENTLYIQIDIQNTKNIEKKSEEDLIELLKNDSLSELEDKKFETKYYKCKEYNISNDTKRVNYMKFIEYNTKQRGKL